MYSLKLFLKVFYLYIILFSDPQFAGSFDVEDRVFFFFREIAVETEFIESKLYSRVGKFCKVSAFQFSDGFIF
jgi:hypothetical protein